MPIGIGLPPLFLYSAIYASYFIFLTLYHNLFAGFETIFHSSDFVALATGL